VLGAGCWVLGAPGAGCMVLHRAGCTARDAAVPGAALGAGAAVPGAPFACTVPVDGSGNRCFGVRHRHCFPASMIAYRYQDLDAWRLANELKRNVYSLVNETQARHDHSFRDQIRDSAASAPANLAEGFGYFRHPEFARHTRTAKSSLMETHNHLGDGVDRGYWSAERAQPLVRLADRAIGACVRLLAHLETSDAPGTSGPFQRRKGTTFPSGNARRKV
jgi:four helix bundle protein